MPTVNDIVSVAEALGKTSVAIRQDSCVAVRNRNATCRRCVKACAFGAIEVGGNEVRLDASLCMGCGACATACPTEALIPLDPTDAELLTDAIAALSRDGKRLALACRRIAAKHLADPASFVEVPCLPRIDESFLLELASRGVDEVLLVDGGCSSCRYRACVARIDELLGSVNGLIAAHGGTARIARHTGFPDDMIVEKPEGLFGTTRRGFFSEAASAAKDTALAAARATIAKQFDPDAKTPDIGTRLRVTEGGTLPIVRTPRHETAINALDAIGAPVEGTIDSRLFATVTVDAQKCNACGMCAMFCPTGALSRDPAGKANEPLRYLEFSASDCVRCDACADACWKGAITIDSRVSTTQLYDFEPKRFVLTQASRQRNALFG